MLHFGSAVVAEVACIVVSFVACCENVTAKVNVIV